MDREAAASAAAAAAAACKSGSEGGFAESESSVVRCSDDCPIRFRRSPMMALPEDEGV